MSDEEKRELEKIIQETLKKELPKLLGKSLLQVKDYFLKNIT